MAYTQEQIKEARSYADANKVEIQDALVALGYRKPFGSAASVAAGASSAGSMGPQPLVADSAQSSSATPNSDPARDALILDLYKRDKPRAIFIAKTLGSPLKLAGEGLQAIDATTKNILATIFRHEVTAINNVSSGIQNSTNSIVKGIETAGDTITGKLQAAKKGLNDALAPVSRATGEVLANATKILTDPIGAGLALGGSIGHLVDRFSPGFTNRFDAAYKKLGIESMAHFPSQVVGSLKDLMSTASAVACLPLTLLGDLNQALTAISQAISGLIDKVMSSVFDFFFGPGGVLDGILPIANIMEVLGAISDLAGTIGAVGVLAGGSASFLNAVGQVSNFANSAASAFSNPAALAMSYIPSGVSGVLGQLRDPQALLSKIIPPGVNKALSKLNQICTISRSGNLGFAFASALGPAKARALNYLLNKYSSQRSIIAGQLNQSSPSSPQEYPPQTETPPVGNTPVDTVNKQASVENQGAARPKPPLEETSNEPAPKPGEAGFIGPVQQLVTPNAPPSIFRNTNDLPNSPKFTNYADINAKLSKSSSSSLSNSEKTALTDFFNNK